MKKWISRHNALAAVSTVTAAAMLTACGGAALPLLRPLPHLRPILPHPPVRLLPPQKAGAM